MGEKTQTFNVWWCFYDSVLYTLLWVNSVTKDVRLYYFHVMYVVDIL